MDKVGKKMDKKKVDPQILRYGRVLLRTTIFA